MNAWTSQPAKSSYVCVARNDCRCIIVTRIYSTIIHEHSCILILFLICTRWVARPLNFEILTLVSCKPVTLHIKVILTVMQCTREFFLFFFTVFQRIALRVFMYHPPLSLLALFTQTLLSELNFPGVRTVLSYTIPHSPSARENCGKPALVQSALYSFDSPVYRLK